MQFFSNTKTRQNGEIYNPDLCLDAILEKAEKGLEEIRLAIEEARAATEERRYLIMSIHSPRIRHYVRMIRAEADKYQSVTFLWTMAHSRSNSYIAKGNEKADELAKDGLCIALSED